MFTALLSLTHVCRGSKQTGIEVSTVLPAIGRKDLSEVVMRVVR
jgi:hypothetical protein